MVNLTVAIARHLSRTGGLIRIYSDPGLFEARLGSGPGSPDGRKPGWPPRNRRDAVP